MATKKYKKSLRRSKKNYKGGSDFGPMSHSVTNPTIIDINSFENDPSRQIQSARNLAGGKKSRKNRKNTKKGGYFLYAKMYNQDKPLLI